MAAESADDRSTFFDTDDFGVAALWNGSTTVNGVFDNEFFDALTDSEVPIESAQLLFTTRTADVPGIVHDDTLVIDTVTYAVKGVQPDGTGITALVLEKQ